MGFFEVVLGIPILDVLVLNVLVLDVFVLDVLVVAAGRKDVENELGILVVCEEVS